MKVSKLINKVSQTSTNPKVYVFDKDGYLYKIKDVTVSAVPSLIDFVFIEIDDEPINKDAPDQFKK